MPKLIKKFNDAVVEEIALDRPTVTIGRKSDNDIVIDNPAVSGHHARVAKVQSVYFIEDLGSTNGTFVNEKRVERRQLSHNDRVLVGKHVFVYYDETAAADHPRVSAYESDKTVILSRNRQGSPEDTGNPKASVRIGILEVVSGKTDQPQYELTARLTIIGAQSGAGVRLTGWFAPKTAALMTRLPDGYYISRSDEGKTILVNGAAINTRADLKDGDLIEVAGVKMYFFLKEKA